MSDSERLAIRNLLLGWQSGDFSDSEAHEAAEAIWEARSRDREFSEGDPRAILDEVIMQLQILDHQLIVRADIPAILSFLDTTPGAESRGWTAWREYWEGVDYDERRKELARSQCYAT